MAAEGAGARGGGITQPAGRRPGWHTQHRPSLSHSSQGAPSLQSAQSMQSQAGVQKSVQPEGHTWRLSPGA